MNATVSSAGSNAEMAAADLMVAELEAAGVRLAFGVISIHNMPFLDAMRRRGVIRFISARGEAGAANMADAATRVGPAPAVVVTSTGTGAGNAAGALIEALTAGVPLIHLTGQIDSKYLDRGWGFIHEAQDQLGMLRAVSKAAWRISRPEDAVPILREAMLVARTPPCGPVSIEIAIDTQRVPLPARAPLGPLPVSVAEPDAALLSQAADWLESAERPVIWAGGGTLHATAELRALADAGIPVVMSTSGRGVLDGDHPASLGTFTQLPPVAGLIESADLLIVAGSHLRSNETRTYGMKLPERLIRIDADPAADGRGYPSALFILGDSKPALHGLLRGAAGGRQEWLAQATTARIAAEDRVRSEVGVYAALIDAVTKYLPRDGLFVRDITLSNSIWANRLPRIFAPRHTVHAMGGGIGQGLQHAIGAALACPAKRTLAIVGDGGFMLNPGELATAVQENARLAIILMNDRRYGVIRNIQDADYGGRHGDTDLVHPDFGMFAASLHIPYRKLSHAADADEAIGWAMDQPGLAFVEVDMVSFGPFAAGYAGPPRQSKPA
jgi:acetolactate synthase-1/2/3 large subunit